MDLSILLLLALGLALVVPILGDDDGGDSTNEIRGTLGDDDPLNGTEGDDNILAFDGNDVINAGAGEDTVNAGLGNDTVNGGDDRDVIHGRAGNDILNGENGSDTIDGGMGEDRLDGGRDFDILRGGNDNDVVLGGAAAVRDDVTGELILDATRGDIARGDDGDDSVFIWGRQGLASGGSGNDTLVLVTGQGTLEDNGGGETDFYILANAEDDTILTRGTIQEFNPMEDTLTLTVDGELNGAPPPDVEFTLEARTVMENGNPVSGVFVKAQIVDGEPDVAGSEEAGVFLRGATVDSLAGAEINVVFTDGADYFDPEATLIDVQDALP